MIKAKYKESTLNPLNPDECISVRCLSMNQEGDQWTATYEKRGESGRFITKALSPGMLVTEQGVDLLSVINKNQAVTDEALQDHLNNAIRYLRQGLRGLTGNDRNYDLRISLHDLTESDRDESMLMLDEYGLSIDFDNLEVKINDTKGEWIKPLGWAVYAFTPISATRYQPEDGDVSTIAWLPLGREDKLAAFIVNAVAEQRLQSALEGINDLSLGDEFNDTHEMGM